MGVGKENTAVVGSKKSIQSAGGGTLALAIAMIEDKHLESIPHDCYPFGDKLPDGRLKVGDAANFGIFKMNWYMIQQCPSAQGGTWQSWGVKLNGDKDLATRILLEAMKKWSTARPAGGAGNFWAGHRWGESGMTNKAGTDWKDIARYYDGVMEIKAACDADPKVWETPTRYYVSVPPV